MKKILFLLIFIYQKTLGLFLGGQCRFYPSCSEYFKHSLKKHRLSKGFYFGLRRILSCHPWNPGGIHLP